jgi:TP901 family phage tail tape measure protein
MFGRNNMIGLGMAIYLEDHFTKESKNILNSLSDVEAKAKRMMNQNLQQMGQIGTGMFAVGAGVLYSMKSMVNTYAEFDHAINYINATTEDTGFSMDILKEKILKTSKESVFSLQELADASVELGKAGFSRERIAGSIGAINNIAGATKSSLKDATELSLGLINTFDIAPKSMHMMASKLIYAANQSAAGLSDLKEAYTKAGPALRVANVPLEQSLALFMKLSQHGLKGSRSGTAVENLLMYGSKGVTPFMTGNQQKALIAMGLAPKDLQDAYGNLLPLDKLINKMAQGLKGFSSTERLALMGAFTGERGKRALALGSIFNENTKNLSDFVNEVINLNESYDELKNKEVTDDLWGDLKKLKNTFEEFKVRVIDPMEPMLRIIVQGITGFISGFSKLISLPGIKYITWLYLGFGLAATATGLLSKGLSMIALGLHNNMFSWGKWKATTLYSINSTTAALYKYIAAQKLANASQFKTWINPVTGGWTFYNKNTKRIVKQPVGTGGGLGAGTALVAGGLLGGLGKLFGQAAPKGATATGLGTLLKSIGGFLGKAFGFLLGPWGMLAIATLDLIGAFDWLSSMLGKDADSLKEHDEVLQDGTRVRRFLELGQTIPGTSGLNLAGAQKSQQLINIYIDGEQKMKQVIAEQDTDLSVNLNY